MKIGLMQPYLFPYLGYFQLIYACDKFAVHDDVQYIRQGWVNRNRILVHGKEYLFTLSVKHDNYSKNINERFYTDSFDQEASKLLRNIEQSYSRSSYFKPTQDILRQLFATSERNVARFNLLSIQSVCQYLGIKNDILLSSDLKFEKSLTAESRVLAINRVLGGTHYINPIGGIELYAKENFAREGIQLSFLKTIFTPYQQPATEFIQGLSIIDVLMNCSRENILDMLDDYELL
jgi:hypothetical protein